MRMAQLRAENEREEAKLAAPLESKSGLSSSGGLRGAAKKNNTHTINYALKKTAKKNGDAQDTAAGTTDAPSDDDDVDMDGSDNNNNVQEQMQRLLGFAGEFGPTKGVAVESNHTTAATGVAAKHKARKYRQYMNRKNGFNRPLDKMD